MKPSLGHKVVTWFARHHRRGLPWRMDFAAHRSPYHVWISEIMLQQTVIKAVIPVYTRFIKAVPDVNTLAGLPDGELRTLVRGLGYYRRFGMMHKAAQQIAKAGIWPANVAEWKALPGVGNYTAAAVCSIAFGIPEAVVDGNVERVLARLYDWREPVTDPRFKRRAKSVAQSLLFEQDPASFNQGLMEIGQTICRPITPHCDSCPVASECRAHHLGTQSLCPGPKPKPTMIDIEMKLQIPIDGTRIGIVQRSDAARFLKGSWGFITGVRSANGRFKRDGSGALAKPGKSIGSIRHGITRHRIQASVEVARAPSSEAGPIRWLPRELAETELISNLDRKALRLLLASSKPRTRKR